MSQPLSHPGHQSAGFSVIELIVTISIVVLITGIALGRYSVFNSAVLLKSQAYQIALDIRQAQAYGVSASAQTGDQRRPFGINFDIRSGSGNPQQYVLFQDTSGAGNNRFTGGAGDETVGDPYTLDPRFEIRSLCTVGAAGSCLSAEQASVAFRRPNFDGLISGGGSNADRYELRVTVGIVGNTTATQDVVVTRTGVITVE